MSLAQYVKKKFKKCIEKIKKKDKKRKKEKLAQARPHDAKRNPIFKDMIVHTK